MRYPPRYSPRCVCVIRQSRILITRDRKLGGRRDGADVAVYVVDSNDPKSQLEEAPMSSDFIIFYHLSSSLMASSRDGTIHDVRPSTWQIASRFGIGLSSENFMMRCAVCNGYGYRRAKECIYTSTSTISSSSSSGHSGIVVAVVGVVPAVVKQYVTAAPRVCRLQACG